MKYNIQLKHYDYDTKEYIEDGEMTVPQLARCLDAEQMGTLLVDWLNSYTSAIKSGETIGKIIDESHRTLQGLAVNMMVSALLQIGKDGYSDPRNQEAVATCSFIRNAVSSGQIKFNSFI